MKRVFTKEFWTQEESQPRWLRWLNESAWWLLILSMFDD